MTKHARERLASRGITEAELKEGLRSIGLQWDDPRQGSVAMLCRVGSKTLVVWVVGQLLVAEPYTIKSVAWRV